MGFVVNPPNQEHLVGGVGSLIVNFGAIEAQTYFWIRRLRTSPEPVERAARELFAGRVTIVGELLEGFEGDEGLKTQAASMWDEAVDLATFRNKIAHGPLVLVWRDRPEEGEPDFIGILDFRSARGEELQFVDTIDKALLNEAIDDAARIAQRLRELLEELAPPRRAVREPRHHEPTDMTAVRGRGSAEGGGLPRLDLKGGSVGLSTETLHEAAECLTWLAGYHVTAMQAEFGRDAWDTEVNKIRALAAKLKGDPPHRRLTEDERRFLERHMGNFSRIAQNPLNSLDTDLLANCDKCRVTLSALLVRVPGSL